MNVHEIADCSSVCSFEYKKQTELCLGCALIAQLVGKKLCHIMSCHFPR